MGLASGEKNGLVAILIDDVGMVSYCSVRGRGIGVRSGVLF